ncbi:MAG TPA: FG-GAP repeat protein [Acidimicrobiales bacterium]|nr:FG-GAP repeat protein [Acidimicrobiales bacterium]
MRPVVKLGALLVAAVTAAGFAALLPAAPASTAVASPQPVSLTAKQTAELAGSDTVTKDDFGTAVAISGETAVVGADWHADAGRAYVFQEGGTGWHQVAELVGSDTAAGDNFGVSVALLDGMAVVGAPGAHYGRAYVFQERPSGWQQVAELAGPDNAANDAFGDAVDASGGTVVVGAEERVHGFGRAYVFQERPSGWQQVAELAGSDTAAGDNFGSSVAVSGRTAVVGASGRADGAGRAYVFQEGVSGWYQTAELAGPGTSAGDNFGWSVAVSGETALVGAFGQGTDAGRAYAFQRGVTGWHQVAELVGSDAYEPDICPGDVAISGDTAVVGASDTGVESGGRAYVFRLVAGVTPVPTAEHVLTVVQGFHGGEGLFNQNGSSCSPNYTVQLEVTDRNGRQLRAITINAGTTGSMNGSECDVHASFGKVPVINEYVFLWRQLGGAWGPCTPDGRDSLADIQAEGWQVHFELEASG